MLFLSRCELEFIKSEIVDVVTSTEDSEKYVNKEWVIKLASKLIKACEENDKTTKAIAGNNIELIS